LITKYAILMYFGNLLLCALNLKFLHKNDILWIWVQLTKWSSSSLVSTPIWILKKFQILNILLQFELWMYFQCLLNSNYRMIHKWSLHYDIFHWNTYTWWNFQIFSNNFLFDVIFLHSIFKKIQFFTNKSKIFVK